MNKEELSNLYDSLYEEADKLFKQYNPCNIIDGVCFAVRRYDGSEKFGDYGQREVTLCCKGCQYHSYIGCTVKALFCKLWICAPLRIHLIKIEGKSMGLFNKLGVLKDKALPLYRCSKINDVRASKDDYMINICKEILWK